MIDYSKIGTVAADLMDDLPDDTEGEIVAVGIVIVVDDGEGTTTRMRSSAVRNFEQEGLFRAALRCVYDGDE